MWRGDRRRFGGALVAAGALVLRAGVGAGALPRPARAATPEGALASAGLELRDLRVDGPGKRMVVLVPSHVPPGARVPLLVLHHGLGETGDARMGAHAWVERYGLADAFARLRRPPVSRTTEATRGGRRDPWTDARLAGVNASLASRPFRGFVIACPFSPVLGAAALDSYTSWLVDAALPRARAEAAAVVSDETHIGGCSLGGYLSLEIFLRRPEIFRAWGGVQTAIGSASGATYAERIARAVGRVGPRPLHVETSLGDPFLPGNQALSAALISRKIPCDLDVIPGPHDQPWLREVGTLSALLWHDANA
jgi:hypothetical protein